VPTLLTPTQHGPGTPKQGNKARRRNKRNRNRKEVVKVSQFKDYMILSFCKNPKNYTPNFYTVNSSSKVAGYKINLQKISSLSIH
jgi:hypothetical protein